MDSSKCTITLSRPSTGDRVFLCPHNRVNCQLLPDEFTRLLPSQYIIRRFGVRVIDRVVSNVDCGTIPVTKDGIGQSVYRLVSGHTYDVYGDGDCFPQGPEMGWYEENAVPDSPVSSPLISQVTLSSSSSDDSTSSGIHRSISTPNDDVLPVTYRMSALDAILGVQGKSEIATFIRAKNFSTRQVLCLPRSYDGNIVFELPPTTGTASKGLGFQDMDREKDCYAWSRLVQTSAKIAKRKIYKFTKVSCVGSLECRFNKCPMLLRGGIRNVSSWKGRAKVQKPYPVNAFIPVGGIVCGFCGNIPFCASHCPAKMFHMYPAPSVPDNARSLMSRLAIHVGVHVHPCRTLPARETVKTAKDAVQRQYEASPSINPIRLQNLAVGDLKGVLDSEVAEDLTEEGIEEMWSAIRVIATDESFFQMLRSIRKDNPKKNDVEILLFMQKNLHFPFLHRFLFPGQGEPWERPHIFKMSTKGYGSGVWLLREQLPGGSLEKTWVSVDVTHRIHAGWLTMSAHLYDHNYRALATIFTCELRSEDAASQETAWRKMLNVANENGLPKVSIEGFMADNAQAGWVAVRNVFFDGIAHPEKEKSDAFHFFQSLMKYTKEGIFSEGRREHRKLWERLRNARSYVQAYKISNEIEDWWIAGNCIPGKLKMLQGWMAWWVVRWRQWGNVMRLTKPETDAMLVPNCTVSESVHSSMRKSVSAKKVGLVEACISDQNRALSQVAAYTSYMEGCHRGRGPTLFELAYRNADTIGSPSAFINASNLVLSHQMKYDLHRTTPLNGDLRTQSSKRKGQSSGHVSGIDSHRPDTVLHTVPVTRGLKRRNLDSTEFTHIPMVGRNNSTPIIDLDSDESIDRIAAQRPVTRSFQEEPCVHLPLPRKVPVESFIRPNIWHIRRSSARGTGPICHGLLRGGSRDDCRNKLKKISPFNKSGPIAIAIDGTRLFRGQPYPTVFYFCPTGACHLRPSKHVTGVPPSPVDLAVSNGTNLTTEEISFLVRHGIHFGGIRGNETDGDNSEGEPTLLDLRIDVTTFPEEIDFDHPTIRPRSRNGNTCRSRYSLTDGHRKNLQSCYEMVASVVIKDRVLTGKNWGVRVKVRNEKMKTENWVQMCSFPSCSCEDFFRRHTYRRPYLPCKHIFWVYKNIVGLDVSTSQVAIQSVLSVEEVRGIINACF